MGDKTTITDRGAESRVTGYGDRIVAQGTQAVQPPAGVVPAGSGNAIAPPAPPLVARVTIYDRLGAFKKALGATIASRLEKELNNMHRAARPVGDLAKTLGMTFEVRYLARMSTRDERYTTSRLDFPLYLLNAHEGATSSRKDIHEWMLDHGIRDAGVARQQFEEADKGWGSTSVEGLGIQPLAGFKKVGFIKLDLVQKSAKDLESGFTNVLKHELGHMLNIKDHSATGVMRSGIMLAGGSLDFTDGNLATITQTLVRLSTVSEADLARAYERQNP